MTEAAEGLRKRVLGEVAEDSEDSVKRKSLRSDESETDSSDTSSLSSSSASSSDQKTTPDDVTLSADVQIPSSDSLQLHSQADTWKC